MKQIFIRLFLLVIIFLLACFTSAAMPVSFYQAMTNMENSNYLCIKNYDSGASVTESYSDFDHLKKETDIKSQSFHPYSNSKADNSRGNATLDASISSSVTGKAHIAWQSKDPAAGIYGRHAVYGLMQEDLIGVFSMERLIHLSGNYSFGHPGINWLPCS